MLGSPILYLKGRRRMMFQLSGFYCILFGPSSELTLARSCGYSGTVNKRRTQGSR